MASKRPPISNTKPNLEDEQECVLVVNRRRHSIGGSKMVGPARQVFSVVNGAAQQDLVGPAYGGAITEFTKPEVVEALLNEKMKTKNKFNLKVSAPVWISSVFTSNVGGLHFVLLLSFVNCLVFYFFY